MNRLSFLINRCLCYCSSWRHTLTRVCRRVFTYLIYFFYGEQEIYTKTSSLSICSRWNENKSSWYFLLKKWRNVLRTRFLFHEWEYAFWTSIIHFLCSYYISYVAFFLNILLNIYGKIVIFKLKTKIK